MSGVYLDLLIKVRAWFLGFWGVLIDEKEKRGAKIKSESEKS